MKRIWLAVFTVLVALALMAPATLAASLYMASNHELTTSLALVGGGTLSPNGGEIYGMVDGRSWYNPSVQTVNSDSLRIPPNGTITSSLQPTTWLTTTSATMTFNGGNSFTAHSTLSGQAPSPSAATAADGFLAQYGMPLFLLEFQIPVSGNYVATVTDRCNLNFLIQNNTTGGNYFYSAYAYSQIGVNVTAQGGGGNSYIYQLPATGYRRESSPDTPVAFDPVVLFNQLGQTSVNFTGAGGETVTLKVGAKDYYFGWTNNTNPVPAPATLLLLGSGLLGLAGWRRFRKS
jgi:hypothetical protein